MYYIKHLSVVNISVKLYKKVFYVSSSRTQSNVFKPYPKERTTPKTQFRNERGFQKEALYMSVIIFSLRVLLRLFPVRFFRPQASRNFVSLLTEMLEDDFHVLSWPIVG